MSQGYIELPNLLGFFVTIDVFINLIGNVPYHKIWLIKLQPQHTYRKRKTARKRDRQTERERERESETDGERER